MKPKITPSHRFDQESGYRIHVQIPQERVAEFERHLQRVTPLTYGDYDRVMFKTALGDQSFRALGHVRNRATKDTVNVPCVEVSFFVGEDADHLSQVIEAIYDIHPYEEPVIFVAPVTRSLHIRGMDEDNPNRFWNSASADWVPRNIAIHLSTSDLDPDATQ